LELVGARERAREMRTRCFPVQIRKRAAWPALVLATLATAVVALGSVGGAVAQEQPAAEEAPTADRDAILLNFESADIREVIYTFAAALGLNYWLDPRVQGQVTARSFGPIYVDDLYPVFLQILRSNGYAAVREGDLYMIVPAEEGKTRAHRSAADGGEDFVIDLVKVSHVSADKIVEMVNPFISPGGDIVAYPRNNLLIVSDIASNAKRLRDLIKTFDNDTFQDMSGKVYRVQHASIEEVVEELNAILESYHVVETGSRVQLIPLLRLNALAVVAFDPTVFANVEYWLSVLDVPGEGTTERRVYVYRVENSRALELSDVLNEVYSDLTDEDEDARGRSSALAQQGLGLGGGLDDAARRARGDQRGADQGAPESGLVLAPVSGLDQGAGGTGFEQEVRIVADELTNSLVILATPRDYAMIRTVLSELDVAPRQVLVEMLIAEVTLTEDTEFGITHRFGDAINAPLPGGGTGNVDTGGGTGNGGGTGGTSLADILRGLLAGSAAGAGFNVDGSVGGGGLDLLVNNALDDYQLALTALANETELKVLSRPHIMTADNQEARILVGAEIPIVTSQSDTDVQGVGGATRFLQNIQYRDTGVVVQVTPQVNSEGLINMLVSQEVSEIAAANSNLDVQGIVSPSFTTREAETTVVVHSGETIVIGGIIQETKTGSKSGVPYLKDLPVLGQLFRSTANDKRRTELIILITPYIVRDRSEARSVTAEFRQRVDSVLRDLNIEEEGQDASHTVILQKPNS
jgi:general secretion pathway protein D